MGTRCKFCAGLSISHLVELAEKEFVARKFPKKAFYRHHESFSDLEQSADGGCDLCRLILDCFRGTETDLSNLSRAEWRGSACDLVTSMYAAAKALGVSDVKICVEADQCVSGAKIDHVRVFDTLKVQFGVSREVAFDSKENPKTDGFLRALPPLLLTLRVRRGMLTAWLNLMYQRH